MPWNQGPVGDIPSGHVILREPPERHVTQDFVEYLRGVGADDDIVKFADDLVPRYSRSDQRKFANRAFNATVVVGLVSFVLGLVLGGQSW